MQGKGTNLKDEKHETQEAEVGAEGEGGEAVGEEGRAVRMGWTKRQKILIPAVL